MCYKKFHTQSIVHFIKVLWWSIILHMIYFLLGLDRDTRNFTNKIYETCYHIQEDLLINEHSKNLCNNFHLFGNIDNKRLPLIYSLSKLRKNPTKERFIISAPVSSSKPLYKSLSFVFKVFLQQIDKCNKRTLSFCY